MSEESNPSRYRPTVNVYITDCLETMTLPSGSDAGRGRISSSSAGRSVHFSAVLTPVHCET